MIVSKDGDYNVPEAAAAAHGTVAVTPAVLEATFHTATASSSRDDVIYEETVGTKEDARASRHQL